MREALAGGRIAVDADIGLGCDVADRVIGEGLRQVRSDGRRGQAIERVVDEALGQAGVGVPAGEQIAEDVVGIGEVLNRVAGAGSGQDAG